MKRIAILTMTNGLEYDTRVCKIAVSIKKVTGCELHIFAITREGQTRTETTEYGISCEYFSFPDLWKSGNKFEKHLVEFRLFCLVYKRLKPFDAIWLENEVTQYVALFMHKPVVWDLMELPLRYRHGFGKKIFHILKRKCIAISHANQYRIDYLQQLDVIKIPEKHFVLHNYADSQWKSFDGPVPESFKRFDEWTNGERYVYLQGLMSVRRYPFETLASVLSSDIPKIVVAGNILKDAVKKLDIDFPDWKKRVYLTGIIPHDELKWFTRGSMFSLIFYTYNHPNNRFCAPNRLYQSLSLGVPVIVGKNEPLSDFASTLDFPGIVLRTDGCDIAENVEAIRKLLNNYESYKKKAEAFEDVFCWENQEGVIKRMLERV